MGGAGGCWWVLLLFAYLCPSQRQLDRLRLGVDLENAVLHLSWEGGLRFGIYGVPGTKQHVTVSFGPSSRHGNCHQSRFRQAVGFRGLITPGYNQGEVSTRVGCVCLCNVVVWSAMCRYVADDSVTAPGCLYEYKMQTVPTARADRQTLEPWVRSSLRYIYVVNVWHSCISFGDLTLAVQHSNCTLLYTFAKKFRERANTYQKSKKGVHRK